VSEYGAGEVYTAPVAVIWYETDKSAIDYDPRVERDLSAEFVAGIETDGVLESITVRRRTNPKNPKQTLKVLNGKTRFRGAKKAGRVVIKVGIVECDDKEALRLQVMLNAHRFADESDLQCDNAARLAALGYSVAEIARVFNVPESTARNTLKIVKTVPEVAASPHLSFAAK
jgi:ParB-like chromosome segregation protein Spo0J